MSNKMNISLEFTEDQKTNFYRDLANALLPELENIIKSVVEDKLVEKLPKQDSVLTQINDLKEKVEYYGDRGPNIDKIDTLTDDEKVKSFMKDYRDNMGKLEKINKKVEKISTDFNGLNDSVKNIEGNVEQMRFCLFGNQDDSGKLKELENKVEALQNQVAEIDTIKSTTNDLKGTLEGIKEILGKDGDMGSVLVKIRNDIDDILQGEYQETLKKAQKADEWKEKFEEAETSLNNTNKDYNKLKEEKAILDNNLIKQQEQYTLDMNEKNQELNKANAELSEALKSKEEADNKLKRWTSAVEKYRPLQEAMGKAPIFKNFLDERKLSGEGDDILFSYAVNIGSTQEFAVALHDHMSNLKKEKLEPISPEEKAVYAALNQCYRDLWKIDFDLFVNPGGKSITEDFSSIPFDKSESENLKDPRRYMKNITAVYVPVLKNRLGRVLKTAKVDTSN